MGHDYSQCKTFLVAPLRADVQYLHTLLRVLRPFLFEVLFLWNRNILVQRLIDEERVVADSEGDWETALLRESHALFEFDVTDIAPSADLRTQWHAMYFESQKRASDKNRAAEERDPTYEVRNHVDSDCLERHGGRSSRVRD